MKPLVLLGTFVHSQSRRELEFLHNAVVCVDQKGKIVRIERDLGEGLKEAAEKILEELSWAAAEVEWHICKDGQFFFPGFIGTFQFHDSHRRRRLM